MKIIIDICDWLDDLRLDDYETLMTNLYSNNYYLVFLILSLIFLFYCGLPMLFEILLLETNSKKNKNF